MVQNRLLTRSRRFLLDTSAVIYFLTGVEPFASRVLLPLFSRIRDGEAALFLSVITEAELLVRPYRDGNQEAIERIADFLSEDGIYVVPVTRPIARSAAKLRTRNKIGLADAIIMATAAETESEFILGNDKDWRGHAPTAYILLNDLA